MRVEDALPIELHAVRNADISDGAAGARRLDGLHHGFLCADTLQHRIRADAFRELLHARYAFLSALGDDVGRTKFACELLSRFVTTHGDDALSTHVLRRQHTEKADGTITDDHHRAAA